MALEDVQNQDNRNKVAYHQVTGSNDPRQGQHDANEILLGARKAAAGRELGLNHDQTMDLLIRQQQQASLPTKQDDIDFAFGTVPEDFFTDEYRGLVTPESGERGVELEEIGYVDEQGREHRIYGRKKVGYEDPNRFVASAPAQGVMQDAIRRMEGSRTRTPMSGITRERLIRDIQGTDDVTKEDVKLLAAKEAVRFDPLRAGYNEVKAGIEAEAIARDQRLSTNDMLAREAFARIGRGDGILGDAAVTPQGVYLDPRTGTPIAPQGPVLPDVLAAGNSPDTAQQLNAPRQTVQQWVFNHQPVDRQQVSINAQLNQLSDLFRGIGPATAARLGDNQLRTLAEVESITDTALSELQAQGKVFYEDVVDPETGGHRRGGVITNPGFGELLNYKKVNAFQQEQLGRALLSLGIAQDRDTNPVYKEAYRRRGNPKASDLGIVTGYRPKGEEIELASLGRERVPGQKNKEIHQAFKELSGVRNGEAMLNDEELKMARSRNIGATAEDPGRAKRSLRYNNTGEDTPEGIRREITRRATAKGVEPNEQAIIKSQMVQERANRAAEARERRINDITTPSEPRTIGGDPDVQERSVFEAELGRREKERLAGSGTPVIRPRLNRRLDIRNSLKGVYSGL